MNRTKAIITFLISLFLSTFFFAKNISAQTGVSFVVDTNTTVTYKTGEDFVTMRNEYTRTVKDSNYYLLKEGEKVFHIPDLNSTTEEIKKERTFKLKTITVTDPRGRKLQHKVEEKDIGEGIYVHIPYYRATTVGMPYKIVMAYKTHDNIVSSGDLTTIMASGLPKDTVFQKTEKKSKTITQFNYNLSIVTDRNMPPLAKGFPLFVKEEDGDSVIYKFAQEDRRGNPPTLEFGTTARYKFELEYKTPKTDHAIPQKYSDFFQAISTNIYQLSLPREFGETKQEVLLENISPLPTDIYRDKQGNVIATFELPANREDVIRVSGYITSSRDEYEKDSDSNLNISFSEYIEKIGKDSGNLAYLKPTEYWEVNDVYIQETAKDLLAGKNTLKEVIDSTYQFVNDVLEYDEGKANSNNERIGAVKALTGGASVCMEYADSMIALLRAQGIPARAALGYTNITNKKTEFAIRHQWLQIWLPEYGWFGIDPTYESSNRKIGKLIDRVLWETFNENSLSNINIFSANTFGDFNESDYNISIYSVQEIPIKNLMSYEDILPKKNIDVQRQHTVVNQFNSLFKTTTLGKAILISLPIAVLIIVVTSIVAIIKALIQRSRKRKKRLSKSV